MGLRLPQTESKIILPTHPAIHIQRRTECVQSRSHLHTIWHILTAHRVTRSHRRRWHNAHFAIAQTISSSINGTVNRQIWMHLKQQKYNRAKHQQADSIIFWTVPEFEANWIKRTIIVNKKVDYAAINHSSFLVSVKNKAKLICISFTVKGTRSVWNMEKFVAKKRLSVSEMFAINFGQNNFQNKDFCQQILKKRRSRSLSPSKSPQIERRTSRRISFSGKHAVRWACRPPNREQFQ